MTMTRLFASALLAAASFGTMSAANAVVPGSETYERARDTAASQSVIEGSTARVRSEVSESRATYGYPQGTAASSGGLVPGSSTYDDAADGDAIMSVVNPTHGRTFQTNPGFIGRIVPGSDSF